MRNLLPGKKLFFIVCLILASANVLTFAAPQNKESNIPKNEKNTKLKIFSDEARYDRKQQVATATGHVKIIQDNVTIYTSSALYNEKLKTSFINAFVRIIHIDKETNRKTDISSKKMIAYHQEKIVHLEDNVRFDREEDRKIEKPKNNGKKNIPPKTEREKAEESVRRERSVITSDISDYWTKTGDAIFKGNVVVLQKEKRATGDRVTIKNDNEKNTDTITIENKAKITQIKGEWLAREGIIDPAEDKEKERLVKERIDMEADKITIYQKTSNMIGERNVKITQKVANKQRQATGEKAVFDDINKTLTLTVNVKIKRENEDWLTAQKAVFHTDTENFEAFSVIENKPEVVPDKKKQVESEFVIPDEEKPEPELPVGTPEPEFILDSPKAPVPSPLKSPLPSGIKNNIPLPTIVPSYIPRPGISPSPAVSPAGKRNTRPGGR